MSIATQITRSCLTHRSICHMQKRYNAREEIHRYKEPDKFKKHMLASCEPYFKKDYSPKKCVGVGKPDPPDHPLEIILAKEFVEEYKHSDYMLVIWHNYCPFIYYRPYKNTITKLGATFHPLNNKIYRLVTKSLDLQYLDHLWVTRNALITGKIDSLAACVTALKKMPQFCLLAGIIDNNFYDVDHIHKMTESTNIDQCRANTLGILQNPGIQTRSLLSRHIEMINNNGSAELPSKVT